MVTRVCPTYSQVGLNMRLRLRGDSKKQRLKKRGHAWQNDGVKFKTGRSETIGESTSEIGKSHLPSLGILDETGGHLRSCF